MIVRIPGFAPTRSRTVVHGDVAHIVAVSEARSSSMYEETVGALAALDAALAEIGSDKHHILTVTVFIDDMTAKGDMNRAWDAWASRSAPPLRACVGAVLEPGYRVELIVSAVTCPADTTER